MPIDKATLTLPGIAHAVDLYTLQQAGGLRARILTLGGAVMTLEVPDETGRLADVVLGFDEPAGYLDNRPFLGALIGRYGNRIARGELPIDDHVFALAKNDGPNHLHGGPGGFHTVPWEVSAHRRRGRAVACAPLRQPRRRGGLSGDGSSSKPSTR